MEKNEQELFSGHERYEALYSRRIVDGMDDLIEAASKLLEVCLIIIQNLKFISPVISKYGHVEPTDIHLRPQLGMC